MYFYSIPPQMNLFSYSEFGKFLEITDRLLKEFLDQELETEVFQNQIENLLDLIFELSDRSYIKTIHLISSYVDTESKEEALKLATSYYNSAVKNYIYESQNIFPVMPLKLVFTGSTV
ncbi:hypothetical protein SAMN06265182_0947 [Persephonella hydrogeniphila]|uniref:Uncharacterized protein n=1 Tax=Persephonella hydrogeniphila TaxID=198703 RepID=A0A285NCC6_9AQUI|nr:hypothetical protein [Persephonella hydrogeniphila]SNZ07152.1 hypothetical protein SAMN06265182_0947 [Persephonella hydrogeniphila]